MPRQLVWVALLSLWVGSPICVEPLKRIQQWITSQSMEWISPWDTSPPAQAHANHDGQNHKQRNFIMATQAWCILPTWHDLVCVEPVQTHEYVYRRVSKACFIWAPHDIWSLQCGLGSGISAFCFRFWVVLCVPLLNTQLLDDYLRDKTWFYGFSPLVTVDISSATAYRQPRPSCKLHASCLTFFPFLLRSYMTDSVFSDVMCRLQSSGDSTIPCTFKQLVHHCALSCVVHSTRCRSLACTLIKITSRRRQVNASYLRCRTPA